MLIAYLGLTPMKIYLQLVNVSVIDLRVLFPNYHYDEK